MSRRTTAWTLAGVDSWRATTYVLGGVRLEGFVLKLRIPAARAAATNIPCFRYAVSPTACTWGQ